MFVAVFAAAGDHEMLKRSVHISISTGDTEHFRSVTKQIGSQFHRLR